MSGLSRTPGKRVWANPHRGFESRPLRQTQTQVMKITWVFCFLQPYRTGEFHHNQGFQTFNRLRMQRKR